MVILKHIKENPPEPGIGIRLGVYQTRAGLSGSEEAVDENISVLEEGVKTAKENGVQLISFPELFLTGYAFKDSSPSAHEISLYNNSDTIKRIQGIASENNIAILCPYPEKAEIRERMHYYDSMVLVSEKGEILKNYRKTHLWGPGEQELWDFGYVYPEEGEAYTVHEVNGFPIGMLNCYEAEFPELTRILSLKGAKLVVIPTAADDWAYVCGEKTTFPYPDISRILIPSHALENNIFIAYNNYTGIGYIDENGIKSPQVQYSGNSVIANPHGKIILSAEKTEDNLLIADCIPSEFGQTHPFNTDYLKDRRPGLYKELINHDINYDRFNYSTIPKPLYSCK